MNIIPQDADSGYPVRRIGPGFTIIPNDVTRNNAQLSLEAIGLLAYMSSNADGWRYTVVRVMEMWGVSRARVDDALKRLRQNGHVHFIRESRGRGVFIHSYGVTTTPIVDCGDKHCVDCGKRRLSLGSDDVSPGQFECSDNDSRKSDTQVLEEHVLEEHKDQDQNLSILTPAEPAGSEGDGSTDQQQEKTSKLTCWVITAYLAAMFNLEDQDARAVRYLTATFRENRTPEQYAAYLLKTLRVSRDLAEMLIAENAGGTPDLDETSEYLTMIRTAVKTSPDTTDYQWCRNLASAARNQVIWAEPDQALTSSWAATTGTQMEVSQ